MPEPRDTAKSSDTGQIGQVIQLVKDYARQETVGPLRGAARWIAFGMLGAILIGVGSAYLVLGTLRLMQTEYAPTFAGRWMSLVPYVIAIVVAIVILLAAVLRTRKKTL